MATQSTYSEDARRAVFRGINRLVDALEVTLGPKGRNVVIEKSFGFPTSTENGVTVAKEIEPAGDDNEANGELLSPRRKAFFAQGGESESRMRLPAITREFGSRRGWRSQETSR